LEAGNEATDAFPVGLPDHLAINRRDRLGQRPDRLGRIAVEPDSTAEISSSASTRQRLVLGSPSIGRIA
jgi:hypothetical protein